MDNPYADWVYRWKQEMFECDTMFYTAEAEPVFIYSAINIITQSKSFDVHFLYRDGKLKKSISPTVSRHI